VVTRGRTVHGYRCHAVVDRPPVGVIVRVVSPHFGKS